MTRFLLAFSGALFVCSIGAFFLFVPPLVISTVALVLMGFALMFVLGVQVGTRSTLPVESVVGKPLSAPAEIGAALL
jgi:hypothetical protein